MIAGADEAPYFAGKIHGIRGWKVEGGRLCSAYMDGPWKRAGSMSAECHTGHQAPAPDCGCGLYGLHPWAFESHGEVTGVIEAWGKIELHATGFRAEHARPIALFAEAGSRSARQKRLASTHGCELIEIHSHAQIADVCVRRGWGLAHDIVRELVPAGGALDVPSKLPMRPSAEPLPVRVARRVGAALAVAIGLPLVAALWLGYAAIWVMAAALLVAGVTGWDPLGLNAGAGPAELVRAEGVRIADEWVLPARPQVPAIYVARLVNRGEESAAWARPSLLAHANGKRRRVGRREFAWPAMVPAGGEALVVQPLGGREWSEAQVRSGPVFVRDAEHSLQEPARASVRLARRGKGCAVIATIRARARLERLALWLLPLDRRDEPLSLIREVIRDVSAGPSRHVLGRYRLCPGPLPEVQVYPWFGSGQLMNAKG